LRSDVPFTAGYITGGAALGLLVSILSLREMDSLTGCEALSSSCSCRQVGILLISSIIKGGVKSRLIQDRKESTSYYEMMDVILKDILGNCVDAQSSEALTSLPDDRLTAAKREEVVNKVHKKLLRLYPLIIFGLLGSMVPGLRTLVQDVEVYRDGVGG
jgi:hypothetical protein